MQFFISDTYATGRTFRGNVMIEAPAPAVVARYFAARGFRPATAQAVAYGALATHDGAIGLGQSVGLLASGSVWSGQKVTRPC